MKKFIALFLIIGICASFSACGNSTPTDKNEKPENPETTEQQLDEHTEAIVGVWKSTTFFMLTFNEDKTGTYLHDGTNHDFTWNYDDGLSCYTFASPSFPTTLSIFLKSENGVNYLECSDSKFYRDKDFKKIRDEYLDERRTELAKEFNLDTTPKIAFKKPYTAGDLSITFTEIVIENNEMNLYIEVTNNGATSLESIPIDLLSVGFRYEYSGTTSFGGGMGIGFDFSFAGDCTAIAPGKTETLKTRVGGGKVIDSLTVFETIIGFSTCTIAGTEYYIDLGEYTIK